MPSPEKAIERGRSLLRLLENEDFAIVQKEIDERIEMHRTRFEKGRNGVLPDSLVLSALDRCVELREVKQWIYDEIAIGGKELEKRAQISRQSDKDPQDAKSTAPTGQPEA